MARKVRIELVLDAKGVVKGVRTLDGEFDDLDKSVKKTRKSLSTFKKVLGAAFLAVAARQVARFAARMFELGSAVEETGSKFNTVFGEAAESVDDFGESFANMAGLTKREFQDVASVTGSILQGLGADLETSARQTERVLTLAADLASFNNVSIQEAFSAVRSGIVGESEPLRRFGILVTEAQTKLEALNNTGKGSEKQLTQLEKAQARLNIIFRNAGKAVGDLGRTQDSAANQAKAFNAVVREQEELLATALLPALNEVRKSFSEFVIENREGVEESIGFIGQFASASVDALAKVFGAAVRFFNNWQAQIQLILGRVESTVASLLRFSAGAFSVISNAVGALGGSVPVLDALAISAKNAAGFLDEVVKERARVAAEALGISFEKAASGVDSLTSALGGQPTGDGGGGGGGGKDGLKGIVETLNEQIAKLAFQVRDLTRADEAEVKVLLRKADALKKEVFFRNQLLQFRAFGTPAPVRGGAPTTKPEGVSADEAISALDKRISKEKELQEAIEARALAEQAAGEAAVKAAFAIGAAQANVLQAVLTTVRQLVQARLAQAIAGATASSSFLGPIAAAAAGALMAVLFNRLMPSGFKGRAGGTTTAADTTGSSPAALGGIRVQDRGFTTGAIGAARSARAPEMTIRVVEPDLFKLNLELSNADGVRAQVGNI